MGFSSSAMMRMAFVGGLGAMGLCLIWMGATTPLFAFRFSAFRAGGLGVGRPVSTPLSPPCQQRFVTLLKLSLPNAQPGGLPGFASFVIRIPRNLVDRARLRVEGRLVR